MNQDELDTESLKIPQLHAKYYDLYNTILLMRKRDEAVYTSSLLDRRKYYTGKATSEISVSYTHLTLPTIYSV